jgi:hypothetical protein
MRAQRTRHPSMARFLLPQLLQELERFSEEISEMGGEILALDEAESTGNIRSDLSRARQQSPAAKDPDPFGNLF